METTLLDMFRALSAFSPPRASLKDAPWEAYVDWAIGQGLAPLAAYNLEYRMGGADAPEWARDRLLSIYQGSVNDNVMKLVNFKRAVDALEGRQLILLGAASFAEALYPHVAFRPVLDIRMLVRKVDLDGFTGFLREADFRPEPSLAGAEGAARVLSDGRTQVFLFTELFPGRAAGAEAQLFERALPMKVYGPSVFRLDAEDALLTTALEQARAGFEVPMLSFIDVRELAMGAPALAGVYSKPVRPDVLLSRAKALRLERALYTALRIAERLFPEAQQSVSALKPGLRRGSRAVLDRWVVEPVTDIGRQRAIRGVDRLRRLLAGG